MAIIDSQGRITIGKYTGDMWGYTPGEKIAFVFCKPKTYRLADPDDRILGEEREAVTPSTIDDRYRFIIPSEIRQQYTSNARIFEREGTLYLEFEETVKERFERIRKKLSESDDGK